MKFVAAPMLAASMLGLSVMPVMADSLGDLPEAMIMLEPELDAVRMGALPFRFVHLSRTERDGGHDISVRFLGPHAGTFTPCPDAEKDCLNTAFGGLDLRAEPQEDGTDQVTANIRVGGQWTIGKAHYDYGYFVPLVNLLMAEEISISSADIEWTLAAPDALMLPEARWIEMTLEDAASATALITSFERRYSEIGACAMDQLARLGAEDTWTDAQREMQASRNLADLVVREEEPFKVSQPDEKPTFPIGQRISMIMKFLASQDLQFADADEFMADEVIQNMAGDAEEGEAIRAMFDDIMLAREYERRKAALRASSLPDAEQINIICTDIAGLEIPASEP